MCCVCQCEAKVNSQLNWLPYARRSDDAAADTEYVAAIATELRAKRWQMHQVRHHLHFCKRRVRQIQIGSSSADRLYLLKSIPTLRA